MADADDLWTSRFAGKEYRDVLAYVHDMRFTHLNPKEGGYRLAGGGKTAWVFQNLNASWSSISGARFMVKGIPPKAAKLIVFDGCDVRIPDPFPTSRGGAQLVAVPPGARFVAAARENRPAMRRTRLRSSSCSTPWVSGAL